MANIHTVLMTAEEVRSAALPSLRKHLGAFDLGEVAVREVEDFDGAYVFRMTVEVREKVPTESLIDVVAEIHDLLRARGEYRFVYLSTNYPDEDETEEDVE